MSVLDTLFGYLQKGADIYSRLVAKGAIKPIYAPYQGMTQEQWEKMKQLLIEAQKTKPEYIKAQRPAWQGYIPWIIVAGVGGLLIWGFTRRR